MFEFLKNLDRRWIFLLMALAVALPILFQITFPEKPTKIVQDAFDAVERLPAGSRILIVLDYDPGSQGELGPMSAVVTRHACEKHLKIYFMTLWPLGVPMIANDISIIEGEYPAMKYGEDYVNLGFKSGEEGVIKVIVSDLRGMFLTDHAGTSVDRIPMLEDVKNVRQMDLIASIGAGHPGSKEWVQYAGEPYRIPIISGATGVSTPQLYPYYPQQLTGLLGAIKGAAEYEQALIDKYPEVGKIARAREGLRRMGPQLVAHLLMVFLIILGNVIFFVDRQRGARR